MLQLTTKFMNMFSYFLTTHFISSKDFNSFRNPHSFSVFTLALVWFYFLGKFALRFFFSFFLVFE